MKSRSLSLRKGTERERERAINVEKKNECLSRSFQRGKSDDVGITFREKRKREKEREKKERKNSFSISFFLFSLFILPVRQSRAKSRRLRSSQRWPNEGEEKREQESFLFEEKNMEATMVDAATAAAAAQTAAAAAPPPPTEADDDQGFPASYHYLVSAHRPTAVTAVAVGNFTGPEDVNLVIS